MFQLRHTAAALAMIGSVLSSGAQAKSSTYYVSAAGSDLNAGTLPQPFRTITKGLGLLQPGDTLYIRGGTYNETILETSFGATGTSWSSLVTVSGYPGETVTLQPTSGPGNVVRFQDGSIHHILVQDLILDGIHEGGGAGASVIYTGPPSHDLHFNRVEVKNSDDNGVLGYGTSHEFRAMNVHTNGFSPNAPGANGMYLAFDSSTIIGGQFHDNLCYGIRIWDSAHPAHSATGNVVNGVLSYDNGGSRSSVGTCPSIGGGVTLGDINNTLMNSVLYNNNNGIEDNYGHGSGNSYVNNTITGNDSGVHLTGTNSRYQNNISYNNVNNAYVDNGTGTVADHNLTTDPGFTNVAAHDFTLKAGSHAIDAGITMPGVVDDFLGAPRPSGTAYDIGAYEFGGTLAGVAPSVPAGLIIY